MATLATPLDPADREKIERRFVWIASIVAMILAAVPAIYALIATPSGSHYIGFQYNTDDHMVYSAWMRQAMDGRFFFDNRFAVDAQPGLTVHVYFWLLGLLAKVTGIPLAAAIARIGFSGLFVHLLYRLVRQVTTTVYQTRLALILSVLGGGLGFLVWHNFGNVLVRPETEGIGLLTAHVLPTDVWQPEGFVFPSMLTNSLFMVSLCLIVWIMTAVLKAKESWKPVLRGAVAFALLMNIHSYDILIVAFALVGLLVMQWSRKDAAKDWIVRTLAIAAGTLVPALWFLHVLQKDPVFQHRAATETFSANFRQVFFGYAPMIALAFAGLLSAPAKKAKKTGVAISAGLMVLLFVGAGFAGEGYFLSAPIWVLVFASALAALYFLADESPVLNLLWSWALTGLVALYFPALFQRKLAMGLSVPWAVLAALGVTKLVEGRERQARNLGTVLVVLLLAGSSIRWVAREFDLIRGNVSNTTVHPVFLSRDVQQILDRLTADRSPRKVVLCFPGNPTPLLDEEGKPVPDRFESPNPPDLNAILSGFTGVYTYSGHWSETPDYGRRRAEAGAFFLTKAPEAFRRDILARVKPDYLVQPALETAHGSLIDAKAYGDVVYEGSQFRLIKVREAE